MKAKTATKQSTNRNQMDGAITVKIPLALHARAKAKSGATGVSISFIVRQALEEWVREGANNGSNQEANK